MLKIMKTPTRGRPPKDPEDRRVESMKLPLTADEKSLIQSAATLSDAKPVTWARDVLLREAKKKRSR